MLWFLTFFGRKLSELARAYFWWSFFVALWAFGYGVTLGGFFNYDTTLVWNKFCQAMAVLVSPFFFRYCAVLVDEYSKQEKVFTFYLIFASSAAVGIAFTPYIISGLWSFGVYKYQPLAGPLYFVYVGLFVICTLHGFILVLSKYRSFSDVKQKQIKLFLIATGTSYFGGVTLFVQAMRIPLDSFGIFLGLTYVLITGYAIHKYQFLDFPSLLRTKEVVAIHNEKLMLLGLFSSSINHELKNPLFMLREFSKRLINIEAVSKIEEASDIVRKMSAQIDRVTQLVERSRDFIRPDSAGEGKVEDVDLKQVVDNALFFASTEMKYQNIEVKLGIPENLPVLRGDKSQFEVIFLNLIINAFHSMPPSDSGRNGGKLTISASSVIARRGDQRRSNLSTGIASAPNIEPRNDSVVEITISDTGSGIPKDQLKNIFKPFYTTKGKQGTGLGLHIVKTLVEQNGGKILVESEVGKGTKFTLLFDSVFVK